MSDTQDLERCETTTSLVKNKSATDQTTEANERKTTDNGPNACLKF